MESIAYLESQLDLRTEELREHPRLLAGLIERVPALEPGQEDRDRPLSGPERATYDDLGVASTKRHRRFSAL